MITGRRPCVRTSPHYYGDRARKRAALARWVQLEVGATIPTCADMLLQRSTDLLPLSGQVLTRGCEEQFKQCTDSGGDLYRVSAKNYVFGWHIDPLALCLPAGCDDPNAAAVIFLEGALRQAASEPSGIRVCPVAWLQGGSCVCSG